MNRNKSIISQEIVNIVLIAAVSVLYLLNNLYFKQHLKGVIGDFFKGYFNDILCTVLFMAYTNILFSLSKVDWKFEKLIHIEMYCLALGIVWEFLGPIINHNSVTDLTDILCYMLGGVLYWVIIRQWEAVQNK